MQETCVQMDITVFEKTGELYKREDESHIQYIHNENILKDILTEKGFDVQLFDGEKFDKLKSDSSRVLFICKKVK